MSKTQSVLRPPAETLYAAELAALAKADKDPKPPGWKLSPRAVRSFICGDKSLKIERKFYGDDILVERSVIGLAGNRGLLLVGEPGTAKSMLSELLAAAISGCSTNTIQGSSGTTEDQVKYSWNYALLLAEGPTMRALVPGPLHVGMTHGTVVRFEEITRCPPEIQDVLISIISEKLMMVPELHGDDRVLLAKPGFNIIATANIRDRGVHEMSSAARRKTAAGSSTTKSSSPAWVSKSTSPSAAMGCRKRIARWRSESCRSGGRRAAKVLARQSPCNWPTCRPCSSANAATMCACSPAPAPALIPIGRRRCTDAA